MMSEFIPYCLDCGAVGDGSCCNAGSAIEFVTVVKAVELCKSSIKKLVVDGKGHRDAVKACLDPFGYYLDDSNITQAVVVFIDLMNTSV